MCLCHESLFMLFSRRGLYLSLRVSPVSRRRMLQKGLRLSRDAVYLSNLQRSIRYATECLRLPCNLDTLRYNQPAVWSKGSTGPVAFLTSRHREGGQRQD